MTLNFLLPVASSAPPYCSKHRVTSQGWNYPVPRGEDTMEREFMADLSIQLPYHAPPEGFRMSASDSSSDADSSMTSSSTTEDQRNNSIDRNRNITNSGLESNANFAAVKQLTTFNNNLNNQLLNHNHKLLKKPPRAPNSTPVHRAKDTQAEVSFSTIFSKFSAPILSLFIKSLAELEKILEDVTKYFPKAPQNPKPIAFKHIDSMLLGKKVRLSVCVRGF